MNSAPYRTKAPFSQARIITKFKREREKKRGEKIKILKQNKK